MQIVAPGAAWHPDLRVLLVFHIVSRYTLGAHLHAFVRLGDLVLMMHPEQERTLVVHKNRQICLSSQTHLLDQIFDEYEMDLTPWKGQVLLPTPEWVRWQLMLS